MFKQVLSACFSLLTAISPLNLGGAGGKGSAYLNLALEDLIASSISATRKDPSRVWALKTGGVAYNGTAYNDFSAKVLPKTGVPTFVSVSATAVKPEVRFIFLPGFGSNLSHSGSLLNVMRTFRQIQQGKESPNPVAKWIAEHRSDLVFPVETVAFDLPGAGWAPAMDNFATAFDLSKFILRVVNEIAADGVPTYVISRSGSSPLAAVAQKRGMKAHLIMTAATYPHPEVIRENREDVAAGAARGEFTINWDTIDAILDRLSEPTFVKELNSIHTFFSPILAISGENDGQTSEIARTYWTKILGSYKDTNMQHALDGLPGGHLVVPGANHFVFAGPPGRETISATDPDIIAITGVLNHVHLTRPSTTYDPIMRWP